MQQPETREPLADNYSPMAATAMASGSDKKEIEGAAVTGVDAEGAAGDVFDADAVGGLAYSDTDADAADAVNGFADADAVMEEEAPEEESPKEQVPKGEKAGRKRAAAAPKVALTPAIVPHHFGTPMQSKRVRSAVSSYAPPSASSKSSNKAAPVARKSPKKKGAQTEAGKAVAKSKRK